MAETQSCGTGPLPETNGPDYLIFYTYFWHRAIDTPLMNRLISYFHKYRKYIQVDMLSYLVIVLMIVVFFIFFA
jgi:hypothetical protein